MRPDVINHRPDPTYLRELIAKIGLPQRQIARGLGVDETLFRKYITHPDNSSYRECPYLVQFALESGALFRMEAIADTAFGEHEGYGFRWADKPMGHARHEACPKCGSVHFRLPLTRPIAQTHSEPAMDNDRSGLDQ